MCAWLSCLASAAAAQAREWPVEGPPRPLSAHAITFPDYALQTLPNGLQVVAVPQHEQPVVSMRLLIKAGSAAEPNDKLGLAHLLASLLDQGTTTRSAQEMNDAIDFIGGEMGAGAGPDLTYVNMVVMKDSFETGLRMLSDMARHPAFAQAEIERQRQQMLSGLRVSLDDPGYVADSVFDRLVYGFHPYGMPDSGTPDTIAGITRDDLVAFHDRYFAPNNAILAVVGDVTGEEAFATVKTVFGDWERREVALDRYTAPPDPTGRVIIVDKPDAVQTEVRVGNIGIARNHPDYMAVNLAMRILGGEGSNRLHQVLRTQRGLTYGAEASFDTLKDAGDFEAETNTRSEATGEVLRLIVNEFWRLQRERVSEIELADAKAYLTGSFPLTIETPEAIALQVLNVLFYGLPLEELQTFRDRVNAVTVDDIQRVARQYLRPDRLSIVLVGNAAAFSGQLAKNGFATYETVRLADLDLLSSTFKRGAASAQGPRGGARRNIGASWTAARPVIRLVGDQPPSDSPAAPAITAEEGARATALLDRAIAAKGGLETLRGVTTIVVTQTLTSSADAQQLETTGYIQYPDHFRIETRVPGGVNVQVFDGRHLWTRDSRGVHDLPDAAIRDARVNLRRDPLALLLAATRGDVTPRALPDVKDAAGHVSHALELSSPDLNPVVLYLAPDSGLVTKETFVADGPDRPLVEETFADYRPVAGVQIAYRGTRTIGSQTVDRRVTSIAVNTPIDPSLFQRPAS